MTKVHSEGGQSSSLVAKDVLHRLADGLSKRTKDYHWREKQLAKLPSVAERWNFMSQDDFEQLPNALLFDVQGRVIPNHTNTPAHLQHVQRAAPSLVQRIVRRTQRTQRRQWQKEALHTPLPVPPPPILHAHEDFHPDYPLRYTSR